MDSKHLDVNKLTEDNDKDLKEYSKTLLEILGTKYPDSQAHVGGILDMLKLVVKVASKYGSSNPKEVIIAETNDEVSSFFFYFLFLF